MTNNIKYVNRINARIMETVIKTDNTVKNIAITNSCAPHHGYNNGKIEE